MPRLLALIAFLTLAAPCEALTLSSASVQRDPAAQTFHLSVTFSRAPDFLTVDAAGRPADEFQFYIGFAVPVHGSPGYVFDLPDVVLRGGEIHEAGGVVARSVAAGAYGDSLAILPYLLDGSTVTLDVPFSVMGTVGKVAWGVMVLHYGAETGNRSGVTNEATPAAVAVVPASWGRVKGLYR